MDYRGYAVNRMLDGVNGSVYRATGPEGDVGPRKNAVVIIADINCKKCDDYLTTVDVPDAD